MNIGVSILTNGERRGCLNLCVNSLLSNCHSRPLVIGIYNNGSTDDTAAWQHPETYGVEWRIANAETDTGCADGTNKSIELVSDCEFVLHIESDFIHMEGQYTGVDTLWMKEAVAFMDRKDCDYLYLRRMMDEGDIYRHWWDKWWDTTEEDGSYIKPLSGFWWSNNPALFRPKALRRTGTLPLRVELDGEKGSQKWSVPEMTAPKPGNAWVHKWGLFAHELWKYGGYGNRLGAPDCPGGVGVSRCKYGFFKTGHDKFCQACNRQTGYEDMRRHARSVPWV